MKYELNDAQNKAIVQAIAKAEQITSAEICVRVEQDKVTKDVKNEAWRVFDDLQLFKTKNRNAILIFICIKSRQFAVIGDKGIYNITPQEIWENIANKMELCFKNESVFQAIKTGIELCGNMAAQHFPPELHNENELPNEISFS